MFISRYQLLSYCNKLQIYCIERNRSVIIINYKLFNILKVNKLTGRKKIDSYSICYLNKTLAGNDCYWQHFQIWTLLVKYAKHDDPFLHLSLQKIRLRRAVAEEVQKED